MVTKQHIRQIIDASGWVAVYDLGSADVIELRTKPLVCWALVDEETGTRVVGMDAEHVAGHPPLGRFLGYAHDTDKLDRFRT